MFEFETLVSLPKRLETSSWSTVGQLVAGSQVANGALIANNNMEVSQGAVSFANDFHPTSVSIDIDN